MPESSSVLIERGPALKCHMMAAQVGNFNQGEIAKALEYMGYGELGEVWIEERAL